MSNPVAVLVSVAIYAGIIGAALAIGGSTTAAVLWFLGGGSGLTGYWALRD